MSKAYSLAGIRVGWIASRDRSLIEKLASARDYTTISVSSLDDAVASYALAPACVNNLLKRNTKMAQTNLAILEKFIETHPEQCDWVKPRAGTTALVRFKNKGQPVDDVAFCEMLLKRTGVMLVPGRACFGNGQDFKGCVRVGYVNETDVLQNGLEGLGEFIKNDYQEVPMLN